MVVPRVHVLLLGAVLVLAAKTKFGRCGPRAVRENQGPPEPEHQVRTWLRKRAAELEVPPTSFVTSTPNLPGGPGTGEESGRGTPEGVEIRAAATTPRQTAAATPQQPIGNNFDALKAAMARVISELAVVEKQQTGLEREEFAIRIRLVRDEQRSEVRDERVVPNADDLGFDEEVRGEVVWSDLPEEEEDLCGPEEHGGLLVGDGGELRPRSLERKVGRFCFWDPHKLHIHPVLFLGSG